MYGITSSLYVEMLNTRYVLVTRGQNQVAEVNDGTRYKLYQHTSCINYHFTYLAVNVSFTVYFYVILTIIINVNFNENYKIQ